MQPHTAKPYPTDALRMIALYSLAVSVSLGVALVSLSKLLIALAVIGKLYGLVRAGKLRLVMRAIPATFAALWLALGWLVVSLLWTQAPASESWAGLGRHARLLVLPAVYFLLETRQDALKVLTALVISQCVVVCCSWLMWLGVPLPFATAAHDASLGVVFTSTLEQPVMSTLMLTLVWFLREEIPKVWRTRVLVVVAMLTLSNVFFVMIGRTGYLVMLLAISLAVFWQLPKRARPVAVLLPLALALGIGLASSRFQTRMLEIKRDIVLYQQGDMNSSQGQRLDYWTQSLEAWQEKPIVGHGVGSWRMTYINHNGRDKLNPPSNPHQQFLLWAVEGGWVGLALLLAFYVALYRDSRLLEGSARQALQASLAITVLMSMMNCPLFGAGMGEFIFVIFAALLATKRMPG